MSDQRRRYHPRIAADEATRSSKATEQKPKPTQRRRKRSTARVKWMGYVDVKNNEIFLAGAFFCSALEQRVRGKSVSWENPARNPQNPQTIKSSQTVDLAPQDKGVGCFAPLSSSEAIRYTTQFGSSLKKRKRQARSRTQTPESESRIPNPTPNRPKLTD